MSIASISFSNVILSPSEFYLCGFIIFLTWWLGKALVSQRALMSPLKLHDGGMGHWCGYIYVTPQAWAVIPLVTLVCCYLRNNNRNGRRFHKVNWMVLVCGWKYILINTQGLTLHYSAFSSYCAQCKSMWSFYMQDVSVPRIPPSLSCSTLRRHSISYIEALIWS